MAIAALSQLVQLGHVPEAALERVREALKRGPEALVNLPAEAAGAAGRRGGPSNVQTPGGAGAPAGGGQVGPPVGVPAPGQPPQSNRPGGPPTNPGAGRRGGRGGA